MLERAAAAARRRRRATPSRSRPHGSTASAPRSSPPSPPSSHPFLRGSSAPSSARPIADDRRRLAGIGAAPRRGGAALRWAAFELAVARARRRLLLERALSGRAQRSMRAGPPPRAPGGSSALAPLTSRPSAAAPGLLVLRAFDLGRQARAAAFRDCSRAQPPLRERRRRARRRGRRRTSSIARRASRVVERGLDALLAGPRPARRPPPRACAPCWQTRVRHRPPRGRPARARVRGDVARPPRPPPRPRGAPASLSRRDALLGPRRPGRNAAADGGGAAGAAAPAARAAAGGGAAAAAAAAGRAEAEAAEAALACRLWRAAAAALLHDGGRTALSSGWVASMIGWMGRPAGARAPRSCARARRGAVLEMVGEVALCLGAEGANSSTADLCMASRSTDDGPTRLQARCASVARARKIRRSRAEEARQAGRDRTEPRRGRERKKIDRNLGTALSRSAARRSSGRGPGARRRWRPRPRRHVLRRRAASARASPPGASREVSAGPYHVAFERICRYLLVAVHPDQRANAHRMRRGRKLRAAFFGSRAVIGDASTLEA